VQVSLAKKRALLVLLILVQASLLIGHLLYQRGYVEDNAARILRNTAILQSQQFDTSLNAMRYQMRFIGNAFLLNHTVTPENAQPFLQGSSSAPGWMALSSLMKTVIFSAAARYFLLSALWTPLRLRRPAFGSTLCLPIFAGMKLPKVCFTGRATARIKTCWAS
jgi:hypothetical protein